MRNITDFLDEQLTWVQPRALKREYVLRAKDQDIATLRFRGLFSRFATGESAHGCWTFQSGRTRVIVRACGADADVGIFKYEHNWAPGGTLEFSDGRQLLAAANLWGTQYAFKTADMGLVLLRFRRRGYLRLRGPVEIAPAAAGTADLPWMLMLGWYLMVMMYEASNLG